MRKLDPSQMKTHERFAGLFDGELALVEIMGPLDGPYLAVPLGFVQSLEAQRKLGIPAHEAKNQGRYLMSILKDRVSDAEYIVREAEKEVVRWAGKVDDAKTHLESVRQSLADAEKEYRERWAPERRG